jgi:hypothetical protein
MQVWTERADGSTCYTELQAIYTTVRGSVVGGRQGGKEETNHKNEHEGNPQHAGIRHQGRKTSKGNRTPWAIQECRHNRPGGAMSP